MSDFIVSAIVSTYASERFLEGCLSGLVQQTLGEKLEIIVIDSGSPENENAIVRRFQKEHLNIVYLRTEERESLYSAWNRGIRMARGRYISNANTDDRLKSDAFEVMASVLDGNPEVALVYADYYITATENQTFENHTRMGVCVRPDFHPAIMLSGCQMGPQPMWRRSLHDEIGYFDTRYSSAADYEFWCRIALRHSMRHIPAFLGLYFHNSSGMVNRAHRLSLDETRAIQSDYRDRLPPGSRIKAHEYYYTKVHEPSDFVNIGMVTFNRLAFTRRAIEALVLNTDYPHVLTVVDNASTDGTREYLLEQKKNGAIRNLILMDENIGVAKASNIAWITEPEAGFYLKLDNDIVINKAGWLTALVEAAQKISKIGVVGYNFESRSYPLCSRRGIPIRLKKENVGGACVLIPRRTWLKLGFWCENYGLYGEEDADYGCRVRNAGLWNAYMEDEDIGLHLPGGKADVIDLKTLDCLYEKEPVVDARYREWKDDQRRRNMEQSDYRNNLKGYASGTISLVQPAPFAYSFVKAMYPAKYESIKRICFEAHIRIRIFKKSKTVFASSRKTYAVFSRFATYMYPEEAMVSSSHT